MRTKKKKKQIVIKRPPITRIQAVTTLFYLTDKLGWHNVAVNALTRFYDKVYSREDIKFIKANVVGLRKLKEQPRLYKRFLKNCEFECPNKKNNKKNKLFIKKRS